MLYPLFASLMTLGVMFLTLGGTVWLSVAFYSLYRRLTGRPMSEQEKWAESSEEAKIDIRPYLSSDEK